jgi:SAM-dependent methyltransferase
MTETLESLSLSDWSIRQRVNMGRRHALRDREFLRQLARHFCPGTILELGASTGHLAVLLQRDGYDVTASEVVPKLVRAIAARGVKAALVDATQDIGEQTGHEYSNILAQGVSPLIRRDSAQVVATLQRIHTALEISGRFISIGPYAWRQPHPELFFSPREQIALARESGLFRMVACFPHQVVPTSVYRPWNARFFNFLDHKLAYVASTRLVWVVEKIGP